MFLRATIVLLFAVLVCYKQVNCLCSWPCNWQERTFYNDAAKVDLQVPNAYQLKLAPDNVIECLIREGPFIVNRRGENKDMYRCIKVNDVCEDSFVVIETDLILTCMAGDTYTAEDAYPVDTYDFDPFGVHAIPSVKLDSPPNLCDICSPEKLISKPQVWVAKENTLLGCDVPKNCPLNSRLDSPCNGCEENQPNDDIYCSTCKKEERKKGKGKRKNSGEKKKSNYGSYSRRYYRS